MADNKKKRRKKRTFGGFIAKLFAFLAGLILVCATVFVVYSLFKYEPTDEALEYTKDEYEIGVEEPLICVEQDYGYDYTPELNLLSTGIIIYPGAKVEPLSYAPIAKKLAERGYYVCIADFFLNWAFFGINKADKIIEEHSDIDNWFIMGHSLGGSMASYYASKNSTKIDGVILLASYSTKDISNLNVLSIYGSLDGVLNLDKYEENKSNLPEDFTEHVIDGANHAQFGGYGEQNRDNEATIEAEEQWNLTVTYTNLFILTSLGKSLFGGNIPLT